jgi:hypothetical protein
MVYCYEVYEMVLDLARKDKRGRSLDIDEFNRIAKAVNASVYSAYYEKFESSLDSSSSLSGFKVIGYTVSLTSGTGAMPSDYYDLIGMPRYTDGSKIREVDVVTNIEYTKRQADYLTRPTAKNPIMMLAGEDVDGNTAIKVLPTTLSTINVDYLKEASTPFLDYFVNDTTFEYTYMDADAQNVAIASGYTYRDMSQGATTKNSLTVNFDWNTDDIPFMLSLFVKALGIQLGDELLLQVGMADELKNKG